MAGEPARPVMFADGRWTAPGGGSFGAEPAFAAGGRIPSGGFASGGKLIHGGSSAAGGCGAVGLDPCGLPSGRSVLLTGRAAVPVEPPVGPAVGPLFLRYPALGLASPLCRSARDPSLRYTSP